MGKKALSTEPLINDTANVRDSRLGAYTEVGARTHLLEVLLADYSYVVNDSDIAYTTLGKFCSIAAMTRINPGNHPMDRVTQSHITYRASAYFPGERDETEFFAWRRRARRDHPPGPHHRHRRGGRGWRSRHEGRRSLRHRCGQSRPRDPPAVSSGASGAPAAASVVELDAR